MKKIKFYIALFVFAFTGFSSCEDVELDDFSNGQADFSTYVALGNSLTAGFGDGTLYRSGQENSYPALLAESMSFVGGSSDFNQPLTPNDVGGLTLAGNPLPGFDTRLMLQEGAGGALGIVNTPTASSTEVTNSVAGSGPFQNLGVPGAKSFHLLGPDYGNIAGLAAMPATANPYYVRFTQPGQSLLDAAMAQNPTFFTLWIGNNDVLTYAAAGGDADAITPPAQFQNFFGALLQGMTANGADGVVGNVPDILDLPYFTVVPTNPIPLDDATANALNAGYATYNAGLDQIVMVNPLLAPEVAQRKINFSAGQNFPVFIDDELTDLTGFGLPSIRQAKPGEVITLPASSLFAGGAGTQSPLSGTFVLSINELDEISTAINSYNQIIDATAASFGVTVADMNSYFSSISNTGITYSGADYSTTFVTGGLFSLDGIHPTQKGYAVVANQFIDVINSSYGANLPTIDINKYPGVDLP